jgi:hypothetical protein
MNDSINGTHLKACIKQAGYTLEEFCDELRIGTSTFYYYRTGARSIPHTLRLRIGELLLCSFEDFMVRHAGNPSPHVGRSVETCQRTIITEDFCFHAVEICET